MRRFLERLMHLFRLRRPDRDVAREIDAHLALLQETYEARGLAPEAARRAARLAFGNVDVVKDQHRDARSFPRIEDACRDAVYGLRLLGRSPAFAVTAAVSLAIGIGANTAIFTVANGLLFQPPAGIADPGRLVVVGAARGDGGVNPLSYAAYLEIARRTTSLTDVFAEDMFPHVTGVALSGTDLAEPVLGQRVTANYFGALGVQPSHGRLFVRGDDSAAVLDFDYWMRRFNGDEGVVGRLLRINGQPVTVLGIASPGFHGTGLQPCDLWVVIGPDEVSGNVVVSGRVRSGISATSAAAELATLGQTIDRDQGRSGEQARQWDALPFSRASGNRNLVIGFSAALTVLVSLVLIAACANVAGIMLTRATARAQEMALRASLGAGRGRLVRQLLTETLVLFLVSGFLGLGMALALTRLAMLMLPAMPRPIVVPLTLDWRVLLFAGALSVAAALVFGILPALKGTKAAVAPALKDGVWSAPGRSRSRSAFVAGQIACGVLLVVLAASFVRVLRHAGAADPGFDSRAIDLATIDLSVIGTREAGRIAFWRMTIDRVRQAPGVEIASIARVPPGGLEGIGLGGVVPADQPVSVEPYAVAWNIVDTGYFATLRIPLMAGRDFSASDTFGAPRTVIISEGLARRCWPGEPAVGKQLTLPFGETRNEQRESTLATVIGVAGDIRSSSMVDGLAEPYVYLPLSQSDEAGLAGLTAQMTVVARRSGDASLIGTIGTVAHDLDRRLVLSRTGSLAEEIAFGLTPQRVLATIGGAMGLVALLLASIGIYGVTAYGVALRRREFAIRLALGAPRASIVRMVITQSSGSLAAGLGLGLTLAIGAGQVLSVFLYGLTAVHVPTLVGTALLFVAVALSASLLPAGQAVRAGWRRALQQD